MVTRKGIGSELSEKLQRTLNEAYGSVEPAFARRVEPAWELRKKFKEALQSISQAASQASSAFTNILTCLTIKCACPDLDVRYHQVQIGAPFSFRTVSEKVIYPWLRGNEFDGAKSGWQTRTFERPRPYTLDFAENIGSIKEAFLTCFDEVQEHGQSAFVALQFLVYRQFESREKRKIALALPKIDDISVIVSFFASHFFHEYRTKGASRLPVLATYAIYREMIEQLRRYEGKLLRPLQNHAAADAQTGAVGDIEVENATSLLFEGVEVKHNIRITRDIVEDVSRKIAPLGPERYYVLTTHEDCRPSLELENLLHEKRQRIGSQIIVNGVIPTIRYYLRLLDSPSAVFPHYIKLLTEDAAISHEHRSAWNDIVAGASA